MSWYNWDCYNLKVGKQLGNGYFKEEFFFKQLNDFPKIKKKILNKKVFFGTYQLNQYENLRLSYQVLGSLFFLFFVSK